MKRLNRVTAAAFAAAAAVAVCVPAASAQAATAGATPATNRCLHDWTFQSMGPNDTTPRGYLNVSGAGGSGTDVITWYSAPNASNEYWCMEQANEGGWYFHPSYDLNLCMDVPYSNFQAGQGLWVFNCNGSLAQRFTFGSGDTLIRPEGNLSLGLQDTGYGGNVTLTTSPDRTYWR